MVLEQLELSMEKNEYLPYSLHKNEMDHRLNPQPTNQEKILHCIHQPRIFIRMRKQ